VKVGTYQRSKGLEFKYVFLPRLDSAGIGENRLWSEELDHRRMKLQHVSWRRLGLVGLVSMAALAMPLSTPTAARAASPTTTDLSCSTAATTTDTSCTALTTGTGATSPIGLSPAQIKSAYNWPTKLTAGAGQTIAIVDAFDNPNVESDLAVFDQQYGLPACTTANGCFTKVNSTGGTSYPPFKWGWEFEIEIDVQWAHAIAPGAKILLVEANNANIGTLLDGEDYAKLHAQYVSNSWIQPEFKGETKDDSHFVQPGVSFFAGSGDSGLTPGYPAASPNVISVGGTQLNYDASGNLLSETGWDLGGGGCSLYETATNAQADFSLYPQVGCAGQRAYPDLAADSSKNSRVSVYDSNPFKGQTGNWFGAWGTSIASPLVAARAADSGAVFTAATVYGSSLTFRDITGGGNGANCLAGFNLCAGRGSWLGSK
jgi:subtilase family serine protease